MKLSRKFLIVLFHFIAICSYGQEMDLKGLFFCHSQLDFEKIWIANDHAFIGHLVSNGENMLVSVGLNDGLVKDTFHLGPTNTHYLQEVSFYEKDHIKAQTLNTYFRIKLKEYFFEEIDRRPSIDPNVGYLIYEDQENVIYYVSKGKNQINYLVQFASEKQMNLEIQRVKTKYTYPYALNNAFSIYNDPEGHVSYLPSPEHNCFYIIDWQLENIRYVEFPELSDTKNECYYIFFDHVAGSLYLLLHHKTKADRLFLIEAKQKKLIPISEEDISAYAIVDNHYFEYKTVKDEKEKVTCHYKLPLYQNVETPLLLNEIVVHDQ